MELNSLNKRTRIRVLPDFVEKVLELRRQNYGGKAIAKRLGCSLQPIRRILKENGFQPIGTGMSKANHEAMERKYGKPCKAGGEGKKIPQHERLILDEYRKERSAARKPERQWADWYHLIYVSAPAYYRRNREKCLARMNARAKTPKARVLINANMRRWKAERNKAEPWHRTIDALRTRLAGCIRKGQGGHTTQELIGCTVQQLREWLQAKFRRGMHWNNYGEWHIDHVIPCRAFDLQRKDEQRRSFHFTNLQPLWGSENSKKGGTLPPNATPSLL